MFERARLRLTGWYLLIIMAVSVTFSIIIYIGATREFDRVLRLQRFRIEHPLEYRESPNTAWQLLPETVESDVITGARTRVLIALVGVNIAILLLSAVLGYFLAGRTLLPIQEMVDEQNRFITDASHELRTPITALRSEIEVAMRNKNISGEQAKKILASNLEEVVALQALSENLLELAQNGQEIDVNHMNSLSLLDIIHAAIARVGPLAKQKDISIKNEAKDITIQGVEERIIEVFVILLDNAIKYSYKNGKVVINAKKETDKVIVSVTDFGMGIAKEDLPHIFDRFYRANKSRSKADASGYGLGLSIAKKIVEAHTGRIFAVSEFGKKTTFSVVFPV